jgi:spore coat-associated protein N
MPDTNRHNALRAIRRRLAIRLAGSGLVVGALLLVGYGATRPAPFQGGLKMTDSNGSIVHSNSKAGQFLFQASNMVPGGSTSGNVTITNADAIDGDFVLTESNLIDTTPGTGGASLAQQLLLKIEDVTNSASPVTIYPIDNPNGPVDSKLSDIGTLHVATLHPGEARTYKFTATFPDGGVPLTPTTGDNVFKGSAMSVDFGWSSTSISGTLFPVPGLLGMNAVRLNNGGTITGDVSSNGQITINNRVTVNQVVLGKNAPAPNVKNSPAPATATRPVAFNQLAPVDPGTSVTTNANGQIVSSGGVSYTASSRSLSLNKGTLTLAGGTYNFCSLNINNGSTLAIAPGAKARIIIDSPDRPGSGCPKSSGDFSVNNNSSISNPSGDVSAAEILVFGLNNLSSTITFNNSSAFYGAIYAPRSTVNVNNNTLFHGGLAALVVNFNNSANFEWDSAVSALS